MLLEPLASTIGTLKERIQTHGSALRENETRTRMALIDPLLTALGWDVFNPTLVLPEYTAGGGRADYALLGPDDKPVALIEAKKLGEALRAAPDADAQLRKRRRDRICRTNRRQPLGVV